MPFDMLITRADASRHAALMLRFKIMPLSPLRDDAI